MIKEIPKKCASVYLAPVVLPLPLITNGYTTFRAAMGFDLPLLTVFILPGLVLLTCFAGHSMVQPDQARVLTLCG